MRFANSKKNWLTARRLFGERKADGTALAQQPHAGHAHAFDADHDDPSDRSIQIPTTGDPTQRLLTALGRFQRQVARAESGAPQEQWVDECLNQLIVGIELANGQNWDDVMEALTDTARVLASYEYAGKAGHCVRFLQDSYEILCLMVGDLIVDNMRSGVMDKWRARYARALEDLAAAGIELISDDDDYEVEAPRATSKVALEEVEDEELDEDDYGPAPWENEQALHPETPQRPALRILERDEVGDVESIESLEVDEQEDALEEEDTLEEESGLEEEAEAGYAAEALEDDVEALEEEAPFEDPLEDIVVETSYEEADALHMETDPLSGEEEEQSAQPATVTRDHGLTADERRGLLDLGSAESNEAHQVVNPAPAMEDDLFSSAQQSLFDDETAFEPYAQAAIEETSVTSSEDTLVDDETRVVAAEPETTEATPEAIQEEPEEPPVSDTPAALMETATLAEPDPDSPQALLTTTQRAISDGNVAGAKLLALELAARMARMEADRAASQVGECEGRIGQTEAAIARAKSGVTECETVLRETESKVTERSKDHEMHRGEVQVFQGELDSIDARIADIDAQIRALQEQRAEAAAQRETVQESFTDAEASAGLVKVEVDALQEAARVAKERLESAKQDVEQLQETRQAYESELEGIRSMSERRAKSVEQILQTIESVRTVMEQLSDDTTPH